MTTGEQSTSRGPGAARFERLLRLRAPEKLVADKTLLYEHALRCFCQHCGSLLNWTCPEESSYTEAECCGLLYRLQPWTVKIHIEDISARAILPKMAGSNYADPDFRFTPEQVVEGGATPETVAKPLSSAQRDLRKKPTS